jgi:hypothetical protein
MEDRNRPMSDSNIDTLEILEAQVEELKQEKLACKLRTLKNLEDLYKLLDSATKNSEEETAATTI